MIPPLYPLSPYGPHHVSLTLPIPPMGKCKKPLLIPDVDFIMKVVDGDIGIADNLIKSMLAKQLNSPIASSNEMVFRHFAQLNNIDISDINKYKKNGKFNIPKDEIVVSPAFDMMGIKALEKALITSMFETQKPYIEIAKIVIGLLVKIEDVIARFAPMITLYPPGGLSMKPKVNGGIKGVRPQALGYQNGKEVKDEVSKMESLRFKGGKVDIDENGKIVPDENKLNKNKANSKDNKDENKSTLDNEDVNYKVINIVYSTGIFDPSVEYTYSYIDLKDDEDDENDIDFDIEIDNGDPFDKYKPKTMIFGIFDKDGNPINPTTKLKSYGTDGSNITEVPTQFSIADWLLKSPKWKFPNNQYIWPLLGEPTYVWFRKIAGIERLQSKKTQPENENNTPTWELKKYKKGEKNILNGEEAIEGDPYIDSFDTSEEKDYSKYLLEHVDIKLSGAKNLYDPDSLSGNLLNIKKITPSALSKKVIERINVRAILESNYLYAPTKSSVYKNEHLIPKKLKLNFKPYQIYSTEAASDPKLKSGMIWIEPDSDYDMKIIKIVPVSKSGFIDGDSEIKTEIQTFVKNITSFSINNGGVKLPFNISISKNNTTPINLENITEYTLDNWNFEYPGDLLKGERPTIADNIYNIEIWRTEENSFFKDKGNIDFFIKKETVEETIIDVQLTNPNVIKKGNKKTIRRYYQELTKNNNWLYKEYYQDTTTVHIDDSLHSTVISNKVYINIPNGYLSLLDDTNGSRVYVKNGVITKWVVYINNSLGISSKINGVSILPNINRRNEIVFNYEQLGKIAAINNDGSEIYTNGIVNTISIPAFQLRLKDQKGKLFDPSKITNERLSKDGVMSDGKYGQGTKDNPQEIGIVQRYMLTDLDTEPYYIIEGIRVDENNTDTSDKNDGDDKNNSGGGGGKSSKYYKLPHAIGAVKVLISIISDIASKLIPSIIKLLKLFSNPAGFVTDVIFEKLGKSFSIFSSKAFQIFTKATEARGKYKDMGKYIKAVKKLLKNSILSNYVYVDELTGDLKFILDGVALLPFALACGGDGKGFNFGIDLSVSNLINQPPGKPLSLIFSFDQIKAIKNSFHGFLNKDINDKSILDTNSNSNSLLTKKNNNKGKSNNTNSIKTSAGSKENTEVVSIQYSTGDFIEGVEYQYIYITEYVSKLLQEADDLMNTNDPKNFPLAKEKLELAKAEDPNNKVIDEKLKELDEKDSLFNRPHTQAMMKFLLGLVTLPIKVIACVIKWIMDFFKSIVVLPTLPGKIKEFLSFKWILDFFKPTKLLEMAGIKFDIPILLDWITNLNNFPAGHVFDLTKVIDIAFLPKLFKVKKEQFIDVLKKPFRILYPILCLFESIINGFIDFVWAILGICPIIKPPHIKICKNLNEEPTTDDIVDLLNGMMKDPLTTSESVGSDSDGTTSGGNGSSYNFIYDIKLSDGRNISDLDREELRRFIEDNKNINFDFLF
jgi:hypothetical protein